VAASRAEATRAGRRSMGVLSEDHPCCADVSGG
jgi:hypothetical protein